MCDPWCEVSVVCREVTEYLTQMTNDITASTDVQGRQEMEV